MVKAKKKVVFKSYTPTQALLLPPDLEELIPKHHLVRVVNVVVDKMDISSITATYGGGGTSSYHPRMLLKVMLYAYCMKIYTGRKIAKALREDINFMWLAAYNRPDFRTINLFRSERIKDTIEALFASMLTFLMEHGYIKFENYFCDGSTFAANANKHKMVWKKNAIRYQQATEQKCRELFKEIEALNEAEDKVYGNKDLEETGSFADTTIEEQIEQQVKKLEEIASATDRKKTQRKAASLKKKLQHHHTAISKYKRQQQISGKRSGFSKTDTDATAMRMKNDEVLPAYNVLIGSEDQFIVNYSVHQQTSDGACFKDHYHQLQKHCDQKPKNIIADSIFGTEENSELLEAEQISNLMKFPLYHKESTRKYKDNPFNRDNFSYNKEQDHYICPNNKKLLFKRIQQDKSKSGYISTSRRYECESCEGCPFATQCRRGTESNRSITINEKLERYKQQIRENLSSENGNMLKRRRGQEVESCFGDLKSNQGFRRFHLRGKAKVQAEAGMVMIAHNLKKIHLKR